MCAVLHQSPAAISRENHEGVWAYVNDETSTMTSIDAYKVEMLILQLLAAKILECVFKVSKGTGKEGKAETEVHVCGVGNDARTGYRFSEIDAFEGIPKARRNEPPPPLRCLPAPKSKSWYK
jgi:hypothetical protein